jgi:hypothetical protein
MGKLIVSTNGLHETVSPCLASPSGQVACCNCKDEDALGEGILDVVHNFGGADETRDSKGSEAEIKSYLRGQGSRPNLA